MLDALRDPSFLVEFEGLMPISSPPSGQSPKARGGIEYCMLVVLCQYALAANTIVALGQHSQDPQDLLQGQDLQEAHST
jgi:hypothetical protein